MDVTVETSPPAPPLVLSAAALFMWPEVASYCDPREVAALERLCRGVAAQLRQSRTSNQLMQRYWNAQWYRMLWVEEAVPLEKRYLSPASLSRTEGKTDWKKRYVEEYPLWVQRTFMGKGIQNNATNAAKVFFHREVLNEPKTASELKDMELTVHEALVKHVAKQGIVVQLDASKGEGMGGRRKVMAALKSASESLGKVAHSNDVLRAVSKSNTETLAREDYQMDHRKSSRKGKHAKGGVKKWSTYNNFGDDEF